MKIFASVVALLFAYSAFVQLNDPDPIRWILLYSGAVFIGLACVAGLWAATLAPGVVSDGSFTGSEEERELVGLLLVSSASAVLRRSGARASAGGV